MLKFLKCLALPVSEIVLLGEVGDGSGELCASLPAAPVLRTFVQCLISCRPERASDVISGRFLGPTISDKRVKFRCPRLSRLEKIYEKLLNHSILLSRLATTFGVSELVAIHHNRQLLLLGSPEAVLKEAHIASSFSVTQWQYADDTQLFIAFSPADHTGKVYNLESCLSYLNSWFCHNGLSLNPDKSDAILLGRPTRQRAGG